MLIAWSLRTSAAIVAAAVFAGILPADEPVDFVRDVQPILNNKCVHCHGPDEQEGQLRLDARATTFGGGVSGPSVIKGNAKESPLYRRVAGLGDDDQMPLEEEPLAAKEIQLIARWIDEGATWPNGVGPDLEVKHHWAYVNPIRPEPPTVTNASWCRTPIDNFVLARLEKESLAPSPRAERARLLRRVYLDLSGLPPTVEQVDAFLADKRPDAYERAVDRLLASKQYGERWARAWLDLARYADSNGFQADQYREVWPYRDWVIGAMNRDMPFDQFTLEQLAGDLLPKATIQQKIATGFHRQTTCNVEAGVDPEENRVNQIIDRVNTTGTVWLGTTIGCVQCHNHPYDPFNQRDYYRLMAYFNNTPLEVKHANATTYNFFGPKLDVPLPEHLSDEQQKLTQQYQAAKAKLDQLRSQLAAKQGAWEKQQLSSIRQKSQSQAESPWEVLQIVEFRSAGGASYEVLDDQSVLVSGKRPDKDTYTVVAKTNLAGISAIKLETLTHDTLPGKGPGRHHAERPNFVLHELTVQARPKDSAEKEAAPVSLHAAWADYSQDQFDVAGAIDGNLNTGWAIHQQFHKPHAATFRTRGEIGHDGGTTLVFTLRQNHGECRTIGRLRLSVCKGEPPADQSAPSEMLPPAIVKILDLPADKRNEKQARQLGDFYLAQRPDVKQQQDEVEKFKAALDAAKSATTLVMVELDKPRETRMLRRGDFLSPTDRVQPGTPLALHSADEKLSGDRVGLARWLVSEENPLVARVTVNRWWAEIFGRGIVRTVEDFGTQGELPSHGQLLDWLAVEFMDSGWSMKHIHKLIVMSATYQQSSRVTPELLKRDPHNVLLARGSRFRLPAEAVRDNALQISGLLSPKMGGPPVFPPQPDGIWRHVGRNAPKYDTDTGEDRFRRGIYVIWRRSAPYPAFVNFDAPDRAACVVQRPTTNTPLQALTLLNDEAFVELAWALASRMAAQQDGMNDRDRAVYGFRTCVARAPKPAEADVLLGVYQNELKQFQEKPAAAKALVGNNKVPPGVTAEEFAAWFYVANILLNLDETITKG